MEVSGVIEEWTTLIEQKNNAVFSKLQDVLVSYGIEGADLYSAGKDAIVKLNSYYQLKLEF